MTIQRQYSLPNCTLILEGLGDTSIFDSTDTRPLMAILVNAQCLLSGQETPLSGGRDFLESLVTAISQYAQEILSGIHPVHTLGNHALVQIQRLDANYHRLSLHQPGATNHAASQPVRQVDISTVQFFDLVEAVDQFLADSQTLPDLALNLQPLSKRYVHTGEPLSKQVVPAALGMSGLALAAIAFSMVGVPKVERPPCLKYGEASCEVFNTPGASPSPGASASPGTSPSPSQAASPSPSPSQQAASPSPSPSTTPDPTKLKEALNAPEISDPAKLDGLGKQLRDKVDQAWKTRTPPQELVYKVAVAEDGAIVGYDFANDAAAQNSQLTPLVDLLYRPIGSRPTSEATAKFKVVFTPNGRLEVTPWQSTVTPPVGGGVPEITSSEQIDQLQPKLYEQIDQNWKEKPTFQTALTYRVRVKADGTIADYRPENQPASDYVQNTPLPTLGKPAEEAAPQESLALFKVVFQPDGKLEVSPWRGRK